MYLVKSVLDVHSDGGVSASDGADGCCDGSFGEDAANFGEDALSFGEDAANFGEDALSLSFVNWWQARTRTHQVVTSDFDYDRLRMRRQP
eukprot:SAG31_NODE_10563_length_1124_cov_1.057561_2_plen_90_part_00